MTALCTTHSAESCGHRIVVRVDSLWRRRDKKAASRLLVSGTADFSGGREVLTQKAFENVADYEILGRQRRKRADSTADRNGPVCFSDLSRTAEFCQQSCRRLSDFRA